MDYKIWDDSGSGADKDGSFWGIYSSNGFYPLGDAVCRGHGSCKSLIRVKDISSENILTQQGFDIEVKQFYTGLNRVIQGFIQGYTGLNSG